MWLGVDLRTDIKKTSAEKRLEYMLKYASHSRLSSQHDWENLYVDLMSTNYKANGFGHDLDF